jgi:hypothetical protein
MVLARQTLELMGLPSTVFEKLSASLTKRLSDASFKIDGRPARLKLDESRLVLEWIDNDGQQGRVPVLLRITEASA